MTAREFDRSIAALADEQAGWFSADQAKSLGATGSGIITRRLVSGLWIGRHPGVYRVRSYPDSPVGDLWAAHLAAGPNSYVSHEAAAHLHGLTGFPVPKVVLTLPHPSHARVEGAVVHQLTDTQVHELVLTHGLPVTTVPWTFVDIAATTHKARVGAALDDAIAAKLTTAEEVGSCLAVVARPRKPGAIPLARLLNKYGPGKSIPASKTERLLFAGLEAAGEPVPIPQHPHPGRHPARGCCDGTYVDARLIIEGDGRRWHTRIADIRRDRDRDNEATRAGYDTLRFLYEHIVADIDDVVATIREVRLARLALFAAASRGNKARNPRLIASAKS
jgi:hypothetical protein